MLHVTPTAYAIVLEKFTKIPQEVLKSMQKNCSVDNVIKYKAEIKPFA